MIAPKFLHPAMPVFICILSDLMLLDDIITAVVVTY